MNTKKKFFILMMLFCCIVDANLAMAHIVVNGLNEDQSTIQANQAKSLVDREVAQYARQGNRLLIFTAREKGTGREVQHFEIHRGDVLVHEFGMDALGHKLEASTYHLGGRGRRHGGKGISPELYHIEKKNGTPVIGPKVGLESKSTKVENPPHHERGGHHRKHGGHRWRHKGRSWH